MSPALAARMGAHAGALHRDTGTAVRNPFRHPALRALARIWEEAYRESYRESHAGISAARAP